MSEVEVRDLFLALRFYTEESQDQAVRNVEHGRATRIRGRERGTISIAARSGALSEMLFGTRSAKTNMM
jgi:hypothetical protein